MTAEKTRRGRAGMGSSVGSNKKDPFAFSVRAWDAPLSIVETSLLAAYAHPPGAVNAIDVDRSARRSSGEPRRCSTCRTGAWRWRSCAP